MNLLVFNLATDADDPALGFVTQWLRVLAARVARVHVITMRVGRVIVPPNVHVLSVGKERGYSELRRAVEFYRHLFSVLSQDHIDVCFSHMTPVFTVMAAPVLRLGGIPIVTWYAHRSVTPTLKLAHYVSACMVTSAPTAYQYRIERVVSVGQGIDTALFSPGDAGEPRLPPLLLSVGRLSPIKDPLTLVRAVALLRARGHDVRCAFVGEPPARDRAYALAVYDEVRRLGLSDRMAFPGAVPYEQIVSWYRRCVAHVNLCPTGALDKAVLEAMACGRPSFVANEGFQPALGRWADRLMFRYGDAGDLADKIDNLVRSAEDGAIGAQLRRTVEVHHSLERLADRLVGIFEDLAS